MAADGLAVRAGDLAGAVGVDGEFPAQLVQQDMVVPVDRVGRNVRDTLNTQALLTEQGRIIITHDPELVTIIAGAGSVAMARQASGDVIVSGGDEWVVADAGSAFWIGIQGIRAAYQAMEGGPDTALVNGIIEHYRPLHWNSPKQDNRTLISEIARSLAGMGAGTKNYMYALLGR